MIIVFLSYCFSSLYLLTRADRASGWPAEIDRQDLSVIQHKSLSLSLFIYIYISDRSGCIYPEFDHNRVLRERQKKKRRKTWCIYLLNVSQQHYLTNHGEFKLEFLFDEKNHTDINTYTHLTNDDERRKLSEFCI